MQVDPTVVQVSCYAASLLFNSVASKLMDEALTKAAKHLVAFIKGRAEEDCPAQSGDVIGSLPGPDSSIQQYIETVFAHSPVLQRAKIVGCVVQGARILWVDDNPDNNIYERLTLQSMGASVELVTSTESALLLLSLREFDVVISDMERRGAGDAGLQLLHHMHAQGPHPKLIFYLGTLDPSKGVPPGAFGITNRPDDLLHLILDVLERVRA